MSQIREQPEEHSLTPEFKSRLIKLVKSYVDSFFFEKEMHCGGPINPMMLYTNKSLSKVINTSIEVGIPRVYYFLKCKKFGLKNRNGLTGDVRLVLKLINECMELQIPKCFQAGIILLYIELCMGIDTESLSLAEIA